MEEHNVLKAVLCRRGKFLIVIYIWTSAQIFSIFVSEREGKLTERMWKKCVIWKKKLLGACVCASEVQWTQPVEQHVVAAALSMKWNVQAHTKKTISNSVIYYRKKVQLDAFSPSTLLCLLSYFVRTRAYALVRSFVRCFSSLICLLTRYFICIYIYASTMLKSISFCHYFLSMSSLRRCLLNKVRVKCAQNA